MNSQLRVAVIGVGYWGKNLARQFARLNVLAGVCDANFIQAQEIASQHNCPVYDWDTLLNEKQIDAIVISTPAASHARLARLALQAGKHVFVEKPLALSVEEAEALCRLADQVNRRLMVGHLLQYHPVFLKLKEIVYQGQLGRVQYLYSNRLNFGKIRREEDSLWSFAPHDISMILALVGSSPQTVDAIGGYFLHPKIADVTTTHMTFATGEQAHIFVSWLHPYKEQKLVVVGDRAMAVFDDSNPWSEKLKLYEQQVEWRDKLPVSAPKAAISVPVLEVEPLYQECLHFIECIIHNREPRTNGYEGLNVLKILDKATKALKHRSMHHDVAEAVQQQFQIHHTACIDQNVQIGEGTKIWHFSHILSKSTIGKHCIIGQNVAIGPDVTIGDRCKIQNNVSIYKGVILEDDVFCGPSCVFTNVNSPRAHIERKNSFLTTHVGRGVTIGANATIICGVHLGDYSFIGAGAVVTKDVLPHALVVGNPARQIGWVSHAGESLNSELRCPLENRQYRINDLNLLEEVI